jgi:predicted MPP superfamily phosphohydrolase
VTNCDLPRRYAKGLHRYRPQRQPEVEAWLHVSAGLGTSPFAPVRFACPPEATLLTLVPRSEAA